MNMRRPEPVSYTHLEVYKRQVEDATELALAELGVSAEEAGIEVLELPQRRLFKMCIRDRF